MIVAATKLLIGLFVGWVLVIVYISISSYIGSLHRTHAYYDRLDEQRDNLKETNFELYRIAEQNKGLKFAVEYLIFVIICMLIIDVISNIGGS